MKEKPGGVAIEEFVELKPKVYLLLVYNNEHKKAKGVNKNVVVTISHNEYKGVLLKNKCVRHSMNRIESKHHRIGTYEIDKISLSYFDYKYIYIYKQLIWQTSSCLPKLIIKNSFLNNYSKKTFRQACCFEFFSSLKSFLVKHFVLMFNL